MRGSRLYAAFVLGGLALIWAGTPAEAQLGSVNNPPPQRLFNFGPQPKLDNGLGTMAERRALLARDRNGRIIRRRHITTQR